MRTTRPLKSLCIAAACGLCLASIETRAQENDAAQAVASNRVTTTTAETGVTAEATEQTTNTAGDDDRRGKGVHREALVTAWSDVELKAEDSAETVVVIGGSAKIHGKVREDVVVIGGNLDMDGEVRGDMVVIGGDITVNGKSDRDIVAILGGVQLGPEANVRGDVVTIGGKLDKDANAIFRGRVQELPIGIPLFPKLDGLKDWIQECVLKMRPLAFQVGWVWKVWGVSLLVYLLAAVGLQRPVRACVNQLTARPATSFLTGLLMYVLLPILMLVLAMTGIGLLVFPLIIAAGAFGLIVGKAAFFEYIGERIGDQAGLKMLQQPLVSFLIGALIITLLYLVPVLGLITLGVISIWSFGAVVVGAVAGLRRERPQSLTPPPPANPPPPAYATVPSTIGNETALSAPAPPTATPFAADPSPVAPTAVLPANVPAALALPRAGFWIRMGAGGLDGLLLLILTVWCANTPLSRAFGPSLMFLVVLAYFAGMWAWKGTTIGGVVLKLQVVRCDGAPLTIPIALVRALAGAFSFFALFLGFFWIGWDPAKQGWHDLIAGTAVVCVPRSTPLVCL